MQGISMERLREKLQINTENLHVFSDPNEKTKP